MGRNWDEGQTINPVSKAVEWPQGPLTDDNGTSFSQLGWTPTVVEAWVAQETTGASQKTAQWSGWIPGRWNTVGIPPGWREGNFQEGVAMGIAIVAYKDQNGVKRQDWWFDAIYLWE
jgi:hypothetical protein